MHHKNNTKRYHKNNTKRYTELTVYSYYSPRMIAYEQLFESLDKKSNHLIIMGDFSAEHLNLGLKETNHNRTKLMNNLNNYNLFTIQENNHTRYDSSRDKMDTID